MDHQDWKTVDAGNRNLYKTQSQLVRNTRSMGRSAVRDTIHHEKAIKNAKLDDNMHDNFKHKKFTKGQSIVLARSALKMTQADLAKAANLRLDVIKKYESNSAIVDSKIVEKLKRVLKTNF